MTTPLLLSLLVGCLSPEKGIDNTRVIGKVRVTPMTFLEEAENKNGEASDAEEIPFKFGWTVIQGTLKPGDAPDVDHFGFTTSVARWADPEGPGPLVLEASLAAAGTVKVSLVNLDEVSGPENLPAEIASFQLTDAGSLTQNLEPGIHYGIRVEATDSASSVDYSVALSGQHPDDARLLVGLYTKNEPTDRGNLVGGTNAKAFTPVEGYAFEAWYEMLFVREFVNDSAGEVQAPDEDIQEAWLFAGSWANLSQGLPAGTLYSGTPILVDLTKKSEPKLYGDFGDELEDTASFESTDDDVGKPVIRKQPKFPTVEVPDPVAVDTIAPVVIGFSTTEAEPNDLIAGAQDLGILTGYGFVDVVTGAVEYRGVQGDWEANDDDTFKFQVSAPTVILWSVAWTDSSDLDVTVYNADGDLLDYGWYNQPEIPSYGITYEPGVDYFLSVNLWTTDVATGESIPYTVSLEQVAP